jgi:hypothetical protein
MQINNFAVQLEKSNGATAAEFWTSAYKKFFPEFSERFAMPKYTLAQRRGVDVLVYLGNDQIKRVDEKLREDSYPDIILEHTSHDRMKTKGWIEKEMWIDYLAYGVLPTRKAYLFPWDLLQRAWRTNRTLWMAEYKDVRAPNDGYYTLSTPVPYRVLYAALIAAMQLTDIQL